MEKWKALSAGKKRFWVAAGILVLVAIVHQVYFFMQEIQIQDRLGLELRNRLQRRVRCILWFGMGQIE